MRRLLAALSCVAVLGAACGGAGGEGQDAAAPATGSPSGSEATSAAPSTSPSAMAPSPAPSSADGQVPEAFAFRAPALDGSGPVVGANYAGRDVVLWMWAPW